MARKKKPVVREVIKLPKDIKPGKETFEKLGFIFEENKEEDVYYATLPEGWKIQEVGKSIYFIIDAKKRRRGHYFCDGIFPEHKEYLQLFNRFNIACIREKGNIFSVVIQDSNGKIIYEIGKSKILDADALLEKARQVLDEKYPMWKPVMAYWE